LYRLCSTTDKTQQSFNGSLENGQEMEFFQLEHGIPGNLEMEKHCSSVYGSQEISMRLSTMIKTDLSLELWT
jgi:hypothetical protein